MQHEYIEKNQIVDRYLSDRLTAEEKGLFEEHFLGCPQCLDQLEAGRAWQRGLRDLAAQTGWGDLAPAPSYSSKSAWWKRTLPAMAAGLFLAALPAVLFWIQSARQHESIQADLQDRLERAESRSASEQATADQIKARLDQRESEFESERDRLESLLAESGRERDLLRDELEKAYRPQANTIVYPLGIQRGGVEPSLVISPGPPSQAFVLSVDLGFGVEGIFKARLIRESDGQVIWRQGDLKPDSADSLHIVFRSRLFRAGVHRLQVDRTDQNEPTRSYRFRVDR